MNGESGVSGFISGSNSLIGTQPGDSVGIGGPGITVLSNGNYVVGSPQWGRGALSNAGAVTFCPADSGCTGEISILNSLIGTTAGDSVGSSVVKLLNGKYIVNSNSWDNGQITNAGAITYGFRNTAVTGEINSANSVLGTAANGGVRQTFAYDYTNRQLIVGRSSSNIVSLLRVNSTFFDYDGDGRSDISVFRPANGTWYLNNSTNGFAAISFGISTDKPVPADYDGDGKTDISVYRNGNWYRLNSSNNSFSAVTFGQTGDIAVPGDFDGDGKADQAVYRSGMWYLNRSTQGFAAILFGLPTDKPVSADYDGDGKTDVAVYRDGNWYYLRSSDNGFAAVNFGLASDIPVPADYDGDGRTDQAVYRSGIWYVLQSTNGFVAINFGLATDKPVPADYDGDGKTDVAVYRDGYWYLLQTTGGFSAQFFGQTGDLPIPNAFAQ